MKENERRYKKEKERTTQTPPNVKIPIGYK